MRNGRFKGFVYLTAVLLIAIVFGARINQFLEIEIREKALPLITPPDAPTDPTPLPFMVNIAAILLPPGASRSDLYHPAANALATSIEFRTGFRPRLMESNQAVPPGWVVVVEPISNGSSFQQKSINAPSIETFALRSYREGVSRILSISSTSPMGHYHLTPQSVQSPRNNDTLKY